ncbi:MAG: efflux RND transporter periplasmic adaptor subunit [Lentisphaeria bacterium]|nr:efflux RND transporter periplasmic adaptor subunit [Lentisphaeria bacterium]
MKKSVILSVIFLLAANLLSGAESIKAVLFPFREAQLSSRVDSTLLSCKYRIGESFKKDSVLMELDEASLSLQAKRMKDQANFARKVYLDKKELRAGNFTSDFELHKAEFELETAKTALAEAELKLAFCKIKAPFDGKIVEIQTKEYETVRAGDRLLKIIDDTRLLAVMNLPLKLLKQPGGEMTLSLENGMIVKGRVFDISPQADHRTGTLRIRVLVENGKGLLRAGMTGDLVYGK